MPPPLQVIFVMFWSKSQESGAEASNRSLARYWLCLANLDLLKSRNGDDEVDEKRRKSVFYTLETAVECVAEPKAILAEGVKRIVLKLLDQAEVIDNVRVWIFDCERLKAKAVYFVDSMLLIFT